MGPGLGSRGPWQRSERSPRLATAASGRLGSSSGGRQAEYHEEWRSVSQDLAARLRGEGHGSPGVLASSMPGHEPDPEDSDGGASERNGVIESRPARPDGRGDWRLPRKGKRLFVVSIARIRRGNAAHAEAAILTGALQRTRSGSRSRRAAQPRMFARPRTGPAISSESSAILATVNTARSGDQAQIAGERLPESERTRDGGQAGLELR